MFTKESADQQIQQFKASHTEYMSKIMVEQGYIDPVITVLVYNKGTEKFAIFYVMVPPDIMNSEAGKNAFSSVAPRILDAAAHNNMIPVCFSWSSEAWLRKTPEGVTELPENWKDLPKQEAMITYFESEEKSDLQVKMMYREGSRVNSEGKLIDNIRLEDNPKFDVPEGGVLTGRFADIFKKYKQMHQEEQPK
jgi:hypothetical protein